MASAASLLGNAVDRAIKYVTHSYRRQRISALLAAARNHAAQPLTYLLTESMPQTPKNMKH